MLRGVSFIKDRFHIKWQVHIPDEHRDELTLELLRQNIKREKILSCILIVIVIILICLDLFVKNTHELNKYISTRSLYLHVILLFVPAVFLFLTHIGKKITVENQILFRILHLLIDVFVLVLCSLIAVNNEYSGQQPFAYLTAMFSIASIVLMSLRERVLAYGFSYITYIVGISIVLKDPVHLLQNVIFSLPLMILALIVSGINYSAFTGSFINNKIIIEKNYELDKMYKVTEEALKKRTEELNKAVEIEKLRTIFFANLSHELRTPLNVIFSAEQVLDYKLRNDSPTEKYNEAGQYMKIIKQNCYRLIRLIANLIDITKIDAGYFQISLKNCDIVSVVEDIALSVAKYIEARNITLTFDTEVEEKVMACDPDKIERIILNLLSNAVKFTPEGGEIFINMYERDDYMVISVRDTGIGIPEEMKDTVFERFVQVDDTASRTKGGSGIGLSIVKSLVEMHEGNISLLSEQGKGSEFIIMIPERILTDEEKPEEWNHVNEKQNVEKINIEFSDIYS